MTENIKPNVHRNGLRSSMLMYYRSQVRVKTCSINGGTWAVQLYYIPFKTLESESWCRLTIYSPVGIEYLTKASKMPPRVSKKKKKRSEPSCFFSHLCLELHMCKILTLNPANLIVIRNLKLNFQYICHLEIILKPFCNLSEQKVAMGGCPDIAALLKEVH